MNSQKISKEKSKRIVAIVPVYNEAQNLHNTLKPLVDMMAKGKIDHVIAINDGSIDNSQQELEVYLENPGFINMVLPKNYGKAYAFYCTAKTSYQMGADIILTLDADLLDISEEQIDMLINPILNTEDINMVIGTLISDVEYLSGQRAIRLTSLIPLFDENHELYGEWTFLISGIKKNLEGKLEIVERIGYGLERTLNILLESIFHLEKFYDIGRGYTNFEHTKIVDTSFNSGPTSSFRKNDFGFFDKQRGYRVTHEPRSAIFRLEKLFPDKFKE